MVWIRMVRVIPLMKFVLAALSLRTALPSLPARALTSKSVMHDACPLLPFLYGRLTGGAAVMVGVLDQRLGDADRIFAQQGGATPVADVAQVAIFTFVTADGNAHPGCEAECW